MSELLELDAVEVSYGQAKALDGVSLKVPGGKIVSLLGGNASGKSTTMKTILGLVRPGTGRVLLDGQDITRWPTSRRVASGIASVPEARRIFGPMTVEENLLMGAYTRRSRADIREDLEAQYDRFPRLGERRRQAAGQEQRLRVEEAHHRTQNLTQQRPGGADHRGGLRVAVVGQRQDIRGGLDPGSLLLQPRDDARP